MFSYTLLLYALVCNTIIGCLLDKDKKMKKANKIYDSQSPVFKMSNGMTRIKSNNIRERGKKPIDYKLWAGRVNAFGKLSFAGAILIFNGFFWPYSIFQYID